MSEERIVEILKKLVDEENKKLEEIDKIEKQEKYQKLGEAYRMGDLSYDDYTSQYDKMLEEDKNGLKKTSVADNLSPLEIKAIVQSLSIPFFERNNLPLPPLSMENHYAYTNILNSLLSALQEEPPTFFNSLLEDSDFTLTLEYSKTVIDTIISRCNSETSIMKLFRDFANNLIKGNSIPNYTIANLISSFVCINNFRPGFIEEVLFNSEFSQSLTLYITNGVSNASIDNNRKRELLLNDNHLQRIKNESYFRRSLIYQDLSDALSKTCTCLDDCKSVLDNKKAKDFVSPIGFLINSPLPQEDYKTLFLSHEVLRRINGSDIGNLLYRSTIDYNTMKSIIFDEMVLAKRLSCDSFLKIVLKPGLTLEQITELLEDDRFVPDYMQPMKGENTVAIRQATINQRIALLSNPKSRALIHEMDVHYSIDDPLFPVEKAVEIFLDKRFFYKMIGEYHEEYNNDPNAKKGPFKYDKYEYAKKLLEKNPYVVRSLSYKIFNDEILDIGPEFVDKISRDFDISEQLMESIKDRDDLIFFKNMIKSILGSIYGDDINIHDFVSRLADSLDYKTSIDDIIARLDDTMDSLQETTDGSLKSINRERIIARIREANCLDLDTLSESNWRTLTEISLRDISQYNVSYELVSTTPTPKKANNKFNLLPEVNSKEDLDNYEQRRRMLCDQAFEKAIQKKNLDEAKNAFFNKYFSINIEEAKEIARRYASAPQDFGDDARYKMQTKYVEQISKIININKIDEITKCYHSPIIPITFDETLYIDQSIKKMYSKQICDSVYKVHGQTKALTIGNDIVQVYEPEDEFMMLVHSTDAYGKLEIINNNYDDSWNKGTRTSNHGICCSLIANDNLGMADVKDVLLGFDGWSPKAIPLMAPYDIYSKNDEYDLEESRELLFMNARGIINNTRHTHNEIVLERQELRPDKRLNGKENIQPGYVIICSDMSDELKAKAVKCSKDLNIPIVYLDKEKLAKRECFKIDSKIEELKKSNSITNKLELLKEIILMHENNRSGFMGYKETHPEFLNTYFPTEKINEVIRQIIAEIQLTFEHTKDLDTYYNLGMRLIEILDEENQKFITLSEAANRKNEMDIDVETFENIIIKVIDPNIIKHNTPKLEIIMENEKDSDEPLSQAFKSVDQKAICDGIRYIAQKGLYNSDNRNHNIGHIERVLFFSELIGRTELIGQGNILDEHAMDLLRISALYHDSGRQNDTHNKDHGVRSAIIAENHLRNEGYDEEDVGIIKAAIEYHEIDDDEARFKTICDNHGVPQEKRKYAKKIAECLKDADALDRVRFLNIYATLKPKMLRTCASRKLVDIAKQLNKRYKTIKKEVFNVKCHTKTIQRNTLFEDVKKGDEPSEPGEFGSPGGKYR